jgi:recombination protein RecA
MLTMMVSSASAPVLAGFQQASRRWLQRERMRRRLATGVAALDALLEGGWPQGKVSELLGSASSGRTAAAAATVAAATGRGEVTAWIDPDDAFDPASAAAAGVDLERVLWVRPRGVGEAVRAAELVLATGGFAVVVLDLGAAAARPREGAGRSALPLRLARAVERAGVVALVLAQRPWVGALAGATVALALGEAGWGGEGGPRWLEGLALRPQVERGRGRVGEFPTQEAERAVRQGQRSGRQQGSRGAEEQRRERQQGSGGAEEPRSGRSQGSGGAEEPRSGRQQGSGGAEEARAGARPSLLGPPAPPLLGSSAASSPPGGAHAAADGHEPRPDEEIVSRVSVGRALRACPEGVGEPSREHARSARSTETNESSQTGAGDHTLAVARGWVGDETRAPSRKAQERQALEA